MPPLRFLEHLANLFPEFALLACHFLKPRCDLGVFSKFLKPSTVEDYSPPAMSRREVVEFFEKDSLRMLKIANSHCNGYY